MKKKVKIIALAAAGVLLLGIGAAVQFIPLKLETVRVEAAPASLTFTEQGTYDYQQRYSVFPLVSGEVLEVRVREGDRIQTGDVIAVVNASDYQYQIEQLRSTIDGYRGQISHLQLQEQQQKSDRTAALESLRGQLAVLEAEISQNQGMGESQLTQVQIQENIVSTNRRGVWQARDRLVDAREYGDDAEIDQARAALNVAENTLAQSELVLEQIRSGNIPDDVYEEQRQSLETQIGLLDSQMEKSYAGGMQQFYSAQIAAVQSQISQLEEHSGKAEILAPIDGIVNQLPIENQNTTMPQAEVAVIGSRPSVEVFIPVREMDSVSVGGEVELVLDKRMGAETMTGVVTRIDSEAQSKTSALGVEERKLRALIRPQRDSLPAGCRLDVVFTVDRWSDALTVPKTALFTRENQDHVWVVEDGAVRSRPVGDKIELRDAYIIESGLEEGDRVVVDADNPDLADGKRAAS